MEHKDLYLRHLCRGLMRDKTWVYGFLFIENDEASQTEKVYIIDNGNLSEVDPKSVSDFSGLYDSTSLEMLSEAEKTIMRETKQYRGIPFKYGQWVGAPIYEGDIIKAYDMSDKDDLENAEPEYIFVLEKGTVPVAPNTDTHGYPGFLFNGYDKETKEFFKFGCRQDPLYWLSSYHCIVAGNIYQSKSKK